MEGAFGIVWLGCINILDWSWTWCIHERVYILDSHLVIHYSINVKYHTAVYTLTQSSLYGTAKQITLLSATQP